MRTRAQRRHFTQRRKAQVLRRVEDLFGRNEFYRYLDDSRAVEPNPEWEKYSGKSTHKDPFRRMIGMMAETRHWCRVYGCHPHRSDMYGPRPSDLRRAPLPDQGDMLLDLDIHWHRTLIYLTWPEYGDDWEFDLGNGWTGIELEFGEA